MKEHPVDGLMSTTIENIREMVDVDTIIGNPIESGGVTIIPVSKVSYGFASGGSDLPNKAAAELFGGAGGAGITITPIAFLTVSGGEVKLLHISTSDNTADKMVNLVPEMFDRITDVLSKRKKEKED